VNVLLDTSVWIKHFRASNLEVVRLLEQELIVSHQYVIAELACGSLKSRSETIGYLQDLMQLQTIAIPDVMEFIEARQLYSRGIGLVDAQLLAAALLSPNTLLWTHDTRLEDVAKELNVCYSA
jgi:predicted nucleic acid-binding protein